MIIGYIILNVNDFIFNFYTEKNGQNFDANVKSNVFKLEERPYFDKIYAHSWLEIRAGSKKCPYCSKFCLKYVEIFTKIRAIPDSCLKTGVVLYS